MVARDELLAGFRLGDCHVEPASGRVTSGHGSTNLPQRAMAVLLELCSQPGAVVSHEELLRSAWGEHEIHQEKLRHAIAEIRRALGDNSHTGRYIQTVPRQGYRLLVPPVPGSPEQNNPDAEGVPAPQGIRVSFLSELKRRGVIETGIAYLVLGWLLIQVADATFEHLPLPSSAPKFITYLVLVGFPIALALAWFLEVTPRGVVFDVNPGGRPARRSTSMHYVAILSALTVASTAVFVYDRYVGLPSETAQLSLPEAEPDITVDPGTVAVLPFLNISGTEEGDIFSVGLSEDVINLLTRVPGLRVSSRGDSFSLPPNARSQDVRRRLRVAYYLEGSVRIMDDALRIVVQLIDSSDGAHLFSRSFDRPREDFFAIQDEITQLTVANMRVALPAATQSAIELTAEDTSLDAYRLYRRGMAALSRPVSAASTAEALQAFGRALEVDPGYAAAHAGICLANASGYRFSHETEHLEAAEKSCAAALSLNPNLDVVHDALGELYVETGQLQQAEASFGRALTINASATTALLGLGNVYQQQNRLADAEEKLRQAIGLQPGNWRAYNALGGFFFMNGRYEEAAQQYQEVTSLDAGNLVGWTNLAASQMASGRFAAAAAAFQRVVRAEPTQVGYSNLGILHYYLGETDQAIAALEQAIAMAPNHYSAWSSLGDVLSFSTTPGRARTAYQRAEALAEGRLQVNSRDAATLRDLAWIKAMLGNADDAAELVMRAGRIDPRDPHIPYIDALIRTRRGDLGAALDRLEAAIEMGHSPMLIAADPHLAALRREPRFQAMVAGLAGPAGSPDP
jgi:TolB-like protein/tetratricopeptide (TPR) repeat protein/DNA-binding winged helix-turn-helix (wHTH) protein